MTFFDGLYNYEILLLCMGVLLFLVALFKAIRSKPNAGLVVYFVLSVSMVGYPSVQSIEYQKGVLSIQKQVHELESNPDDQTLRTSLEQDVAKIQERPSKEAASSVALAQAHFALGNDAAAKTSLDAALQKNPTLPAARELDQKMVLAERLKTLTSQVQASPNDTAAKQQLEQAVSQVSKAPIANPQTRQTAQRAQAILKAQSVMVPRGAATVDPNLRNRIRAERVTPQ